MNIILCTLKWPGLIEKWKANGLYQDNCKVEGLNEPDKWFTQPEIFRGKALFSFLDFHYLITNGRCHIARNGYPGAGISKYAWQKVAQNERQSNTGLNLAFVDDVADPQSNSAAKIYFSEEVQNVMTENADTNEAHFCY